MTDSAPEVEVPAPEVPEVPDPVEEVPDPPHEPEHDDNLTERVGALEGTVSDIVSKVEGLLHPVSDEMPNHGEIVPDEKPTSRPWTHKKLFGK